MVRKLLIGILALVGLSFSVYSMDHFVGATGRSINLDASMTGRINMAPSGITGSHIGMKKGDKILMGVKNPAYDKPLEWQLIRKETYTDYGCMTSPSTDPYVNVANTCNNSAITAWLSYSEDIGLVAPALKTSDFKIWPEMSVVFQRDQHAFYLQSNNIVNLYNNLQASINNSISDNQLQAMRNLGESRDFYNSLKQLTPSGTIQELQVLTLGNVFSWYSSYNAMMKSVFTPVIVDHYISVDKGYDLVDFAYEKDYFFGYFYHADGEADLNYGYLLMKPDGTLPFVSDKAALSSTNKFLVRSATYLDMNDVVFAVSANSGDGSSNIAGITQPVLPTSYTNIYTATKKYSGMKVRLQNSDMQADLISMKNKLGNPVQTVNAGTEVTLQVDANAGTDGGTGVNTISVIVFDQNDNFKYYKPLETTKNGTQDYVFDTTGMNPGNYKISVVNEVYDETSTSPADSSLISEPIDLTIVAPLTNVQASDATFTVGDPEVVDNGQVSTITSIGGIQPITYTLVSDETQVGHENDYQYFEVSGNQILVNKTDGLDAGDYYFKVQGVDAEGGPVGGVLSNTVHIRVNKKKLTVVFDNPEQTEKTINELPSGWSETATATPSDGTKVTYSIAGGTLGLINIDRDTGAITAGSQSGYGKVIIQAIADDDPSTGKDNYEESSPAIKEIVIVREVDGALVPDDASSDLYIPTFEADEANIKTGGTIGHVEGRRGTPDNGESGKTTYEYEIVNEGEHYSYFSIDLYTGEITSKVNLEVGIYQFKVKVSDKWTSKEISVEVRVGQAAAEELSFYDPDNTNTKITTQTATIGDTGVHVLAKGANPSNTNPVTYSIKDGSSNVITVNQASGAVMIHGVGTVIVVAQKDGMSGQANAVAELTFTVEQGEQDFIYTDQAENQLPTSGTNYLPYEEVYGKGKEFQLYTDGAVDGAQITYALKSESPTDVITVSSSGLVHILNANLNNQIGKVIVEATSHDPSGNYADKTIELPIQINKATQTISFKDNPIYVENGTGSITPIVIAQDISNEDGSITDGDYTVSVDGSSYAGTAWCNDGKTIHYSHTGSRTNIPLLVSKAGNRNYEATSDTQGILTILGPGESILAISSPGKVTYGDEFEIKSMQDDSGSTNVQYTFTIGNQTYISEVSKSGNKVVLEAIKASGDQMIDITVTRTADGETTLTKTISIKVWPKDITIEVEDKTKKEGEVNPALTYVDFDDQLVRGDQIAQQDIRLSTTATTNSGAGSYPITVDVAYLNSKYPNYNFIQNAGTLTIQNNTIDNSWIHLETADGQHYNSVWTNQNVYLVSDNTTYPQISLDKQVWDARPEVSSEGNHTYAFWMKSTSGAITTQGTTASIKIDKTDPVINNIRVLQATRNAYENFMNTISFGMLYGNQKVVQVQATDPILGGVNEVSNIAEITYTLQKLDANLLPDGNPTTGKLSGSDREISVSGSGMHEVCAIAYDNAGNASSEHCEQVDLGVDENIDSNQNGCQDLNIEMPDGILNEDVNGDGIPELNIDTDMDGKADINIDSDGDGRPDINVVSLTKWEPNSTCTVIDGVQYETMLNLKPVINIDVDGDGIPDIDIDNDGDLKGDLNISKDGKTPSLNLSDIHEWNPDTNYDHFGFAYDSISSEQYKPQLNIDTDEDGLPDLNLDLDNDKVPDLNIDTDGDGIPNIQIDSDGDRQPDVNIDEDDDGNADKNIVEVEEWKPQHDVDGEFPYDTMTDLTDDQQDLEDNDVIVRDPDGTFPFNYRLVVEDVTETVDALIKDNIMNQLQDKENIHTIYEITLWKDKEIIQPNGTVEISLPKIEGTTIKRLLVEQEDGTWLEVPFTETAQHYVYESAYLKRVCIVYEDIENVVEDETASNNSSYTAVGGANTMDVTQGKLYGILTLLSMILLFYIIYKQKDEETGV